MTADSENMGGYKFNIFTSNLSIYIYVYISQVLPCIDAKSTKNKLSHGAVHGENEGEG